MSMPDGAAAPAADEPDDGLTTEERAQFNEMQAADAAQPDPGTPANPSPDAAAKTAAAAAAAAAAEVNAGAGDDDDDDEPKPVDPAAPVDPNAQKTPRRIRFSKFKAVEDRAIASEAEATRLREQQARLDERLKIINEALATPAEAKPPVDEDPEPDPEADIFAHNAWLKREMIRRDERNTSAITEIRQGRQTETADQEVANNYMADAQAYAAKEPNFAAAYQFLMDTRIHQLALFRYEKDLTEPGAQLTASERAAISREIATEERGIVQNALKSKKSPAAAVFMMAKASGYRPAPAADAPAPGAAPVPGGARPTASPASPAARPAAAPAAAATVNGQPSVRDEIARVRDGQASSLSLSNGGGAPHTPLTAERLANMPQAEFDRMVEEMPPEQWKAMMGG